MTQVIIYLIGSIFAVLLTMKRIRGYNNSLLEERPECLIVYMAAAIGSWFMVITLILTKNGQDN